MNEQDWMEFLKELTLLGSSVLPVDDAQLKSHEQEFGFALPQSYRAYCSVFGAGEFSECFRVAAPGYAGNGVFYNLAELDAEMHSGLDWKEYAPDPDQFERAVIFGNDVSRNIYFWDTSFLTDAPASEYAVFVKHEDWETKQIAASFWELVTEVWLGKHHIELFDDEPRKTFQPAS